MHLRHLIALAAAATSLAVPAAAQAAPIVGIADNKTDMFGDPVFKSVGFRHARVVVHWDVVKTGGAQLAHLDTWMAGAKAHGVQPLVTLHNGKARPTPKAMATQLKAIRKRYRAMGLKLRDFATWNEANLGARPKSKRDPGGKKATDVAKWWLAQVRACPTCRIMPTELVDVPNMVNWVKAFNKALPKGKRVKIWGLHNYVDVNTFGTKETKALLRVTKKGEVWLTETGGVQFRQNTSRVKFKGDGATHAANATNHLFTKVAALSPRIKRVYIYHWNTGGQASTWDSALVGDDGAPRPSLLALVALLRAGKAKLK